MKRTFEFLVAAIVAALAISSAQADPVSFKGDVAPLLINSCLACHGPKKAEGGYRIDTFEKVMAAGDSTSPGFHAKDLEGSEAFRRMIETNPKERMPLDGDPMTAEQIATVKKWIEEGANFDGPDPKAPLASYIPAPKHPAGPEKYSATMPITALAFTPDGSQLLAAGYHEVTVWNPADGQLIRRINNVGQRTYGLSVSPDGQLLAVACGAPGRLGECRIFKLDSGELVRVISTTSDVVYDCQFNPAGDRIATAAADGSVRVFEVATGKEQNTITSHSDWVFAVAWSPDGNKLASASRDKTAKVYDAKTGDLLITYSAHNKEVRGVMFHPDGAEVYSSGSDNKIQRWTVSEAKKSAEVGFGGEVYKLAAGGEFFLTSSAEAKVRQFNAKDQKQIREYPGAKDWVLSAAYHAGTQRIAGGTFDGQVIIWNAEDGKQVVAFTAAPGFTPPAPAEKPAEKK
ncbi:translocation protein TolB [Anatilimnocola aggregata]|uniref:Translocation protein TolB n=1 Tax=Anatilimnocola aggregata TaxID=2528021 RepID=A0A517YCM3_9BACT|nr:c-type cytochrome domain-containing protein [Anatilimnocola aggregata]QDU27978.1 translocation protein TolB [Anatilimnocola aggregata]